MWVKNLEDMLLLLTASGAVKVNTGLYINFVNECLKDTLEKAENSSFSDF
jgi:hypothetical protein